MKNFNGNETLSPSQQSAQSGAEAAPGAPGAKAEEPVRVDGFAQVLAMLRIADPEFRESLLRRLAARDPNLARTLRQDLSAD